MSAITSRSFGLPVMQVSLQPSRSANASENAAAPSDARTQWREAQQKQWDEARQALSQIPNAHETKAAMEAARKAIAAEKVQRIKNQIMMLRSLGTMGDAKAMMRQIAQLARELASAVREYSSAGGGAVSAGAVASPQSVEVASQGEGKANPSDSAEPYVVDVRPQHGVDKANARTMTAQDADQSISTGMPAVVGMAISLYQQHAMESETAGKSDDRAFIREVKEVLEQLKLLAKLQTTRLKMQEGVDNKAEMAAAQSSTDAALEDVQKALDDLVSGMVAAVR